MYSSNIDYFQSRLLPEAPNAPPESTNSNAFYVAVCFVSAPDFGLEHQLNFIIESEGIEIECTL